MKGINVLVLADEARRAAVAGVLFLFGIPSAVTSARRQRMYVFLIFRV
jgi:hypothetical protein